MYIVARDWDSDLQMDQRVRSKKSGPSTQEMTMFVAVSHGYHIEGGQWMLWRLWVANSNPVAEAFHSIEGTYYGHLASDGNGA
jgi:hypothetical protein